MMANSTDFDQKLREAFHCLLADKATEAIEISEALEAEFPERAEQLFVLGMAAMFLDDLPSMKKLLEEGHKRAPECREFSDLLASVHVRLGNLADSVYFAKLGLVAESSPLLAEMIPDEFKNLDDLLDHVGYAQYGINGWIAFHERRYADAAEMAEKEIALNGGDADCFFLLARARGELHDYRGAIDAVKTAIDKDNTNTEQMTFLGDLLQLIGNLKEALEVYHEAIRRNPDSLPARNRLICALTYAASDDWKSVSDAIGGLNDILESRPPLPTVAKRRALPNPLTRIRIAYLVNEKAISTHAVFLETALTYRDEDRFRVNVYQQYSQPLLADSRLRRLADDWRETYDVDDVTLARIIENDDIHILVDMCGFEHGNRQELLASKVCPLQINWLGMPLVACKATTDVVLIDEIVDTDEHIDGVERFHIPGCMVCYAGGSVGIEMSDKNPSPFERSKRICFGGIFDLTYLEMTIDLWAQVLDAVPDSRLILGAGGQINKDMQDIADRMFEAKGLAGRVDILPPTSKSSDRAELLSAIDIFLDSQYSIGADMVCDSLWMGVPVVSLLRDRATARLGASILKAAGFENWIASDDRNFIDIAVKLSADGAGIMELRKTLRDRVLASSLCDTSDFMKRMEGAFEAICAEHIGPN